MGFLYAYFLLRLLSFCFKIRQSGQTSSRGHFVKIHPYTRLKLEARDKYTMKAAGKPKRRRSYYVSYSDVNLFYINLCNQVLGIFVDRGRRQWLYLQKTG